MKFLQRSFTQKAPIVTLGDRKVALRSLTPLLAPKLGAAAELIKDQYDPDTGFSLAYVATHSTTPDEALELLGDPERIKGEMVRLSAQISFNDAVAIGEYLSSLLDRLRKVQVEVPGKPDAA